MKKADIKMWMITGDKKDTAINIAYASGFYDIDFPPEILDLKKIDLLKKSDKQKQKKKLNRWKFRW